MLDQSFSDMSAKENAVACNLRHACGLAYKVKPALADIGQELGTKAERKNTHTHDARNTQTPPRRGGHTNGVKKTPRTFSE